MQTLMPYSLRVLRIEERMTTPGFCEGQAELKKFTRHNRANDC